MIAATMDGERSETLHLFDESFDKILEVKRIQPQARQAILNASSTGFQVCEV